MGCFGDLQTVKQTGTTSKTSPPDWVKRAGEQNYDLARSVLDKGFQPYTGELTAPLSSNERQASDITSRLAGTPNPYLTDIETALRGAGSAPAFNYNFYSAVNPDSPVGPVSDYMDPYLEAVLAPQLRDIALAGQQQRHGINANATAAGAFGDARHGVVEALQRKNEGQLVGDVTGRAYSGAYNTAQALREQDLARLLSTERAQEGADESRLSRMRQSGIDLSGLDTSEIGRALGLATALGQTGETERNVRQAADTAAYQEEMRKQGFTDNQIAFLTSILSGTPTEKTTVQTQDIQQPNNSGWQAAGSLAGTALQAALPAALAFI